MSIETTQKKLNQFFLDKLNQFGISSKGVGYNGKQAHETRFEQLIKLLDRNNHFSLIDYGCGYGALYDYLASAGYELDYYGYDIMPEMVQIAKDKHKSLPNVRFFENEKHLPISDYLIAGGIFNVKFECSDEDWTKHILLHLGRMNRLCKKGFSFDLLTSYSDKEKMQAELYYADPCFFFDFCKRNFSRNVALLHDYQIFDFTIIVRK